MEKELTFHPQIPHKNISNCTTNSDFFDRNKAVSRRPEPLSTRELQECSFQPKIHTNLESSGNIHEKLYMQAIIKQK